MILSYYHIITSSYHNKSIYKTFNALTMKQNMLSESTYVKWYLNREQKQNIEFSIWMSKVEHKIKQKFGLDLLDLPDEDYIIYFELSYSPDMLVKLICKSNGLV